ncbi:MAG: hypothetical protein HY319_15025 [Armatimonadetes bacterium]|nr:hypothetical protein [Armatimonadota bacterium]
MLIILALVAVANWLGIDQSQEPPEPMPQEFMLTAVASGHRLAFEVAWSGEGPPRYRARLEQRTTRPLAYAEGEMTREEFRVFFAGLEAEGLYRLPPRDWNQPPEDEPNWQLAIESPQQEHFAQFFGAPSGNFRRVLAFLERTAMATAMAQLRMQLEQTLPTGARPDERLLTLMGWQSRPRLERQGQVAVHQCRTIPIEGRLDPSGRFYLWPGKASID